MLELFLDNLLPVFLAAGTGWLLSSRMQLDPRPLAHVGFYIFAPCFVFQILMNGEVRGRAFLQVAGFAAISLLILAAVTAFVAWRLGWSRSMVAAVTLVVLLPNAGNFGLAASRFAFGEAGLAQAGAYFVTGSLLTFTVGTMVASLGRSGVLATLLGLLRVPAIWGMALALILLRTGWQLPVPVERTVEVLSRAAIPVFLVLLGMQLHGAGIRARRAPLTLACVARLAGGAAIGIALAALIGLEGVARQAAVLQSGMPSAVITIVIATEYDLEPAFVTAAVVTTTLLSPLTLTPLLALLGA